MPTPGIDNYLTREPAPRKGDRCVVCGNVPLFDGMDATLEGLVCESCFAEEFRRCEDCGDGIRTDQALEIFEDGAGTETYQCFACAMAEKNKAQRELDHKEAAVDIRIDEARDARMERRP